MGSVSSPQGKGSLMHNRRDHEKYGLKMPENIDQSRSGENITLVDRDIHEAYREIFGEAMAKYNEKQTRADRKIDDYYDHILKSKNGEKPFYEVVFQWGKKDDFNNPLEPFNRTRAKDALVEYAQTFQERNPQLIVIGAYIHMDEASPHLHLDYVPVAHGYKRGMEIRNSLDKAMKQMGHIPEEQNRKNNATKLWKDSERAVFAGICMDHGLTVDAERKSSRKSLSVEEYKDARDEMLGEIREEHRELVKAASEVKKERDTAAAELDAVQIQIQPLRTEVLDLESREKKLKSRVSNLEDQVQSLEDVKSTLQEDLDELDQQWDQKNLQAKLDAAIDKNSRLQADLNKAVGFITTFRDENKRLRADNNALRAENASLRDQMTQKVVEAVKPLKEQIEALQGRLRTVFEVLRDVVKATGLFKYGTKGGFYRIDDLTERQGRLLDKVADYAAAEARKEGFEDVAKDIEKNVGFSDAIRELIEVPEKTKPIQPER